MPWSWVDTEYSILRVQHSLSTAYIQDWLSSLDSYDYELTPECSFIFRRTSLHDRPPSASSPCELKCKVTLSHSHGCGSTIWRIESQHWARRPSTAPKYSSNLARSWPQSASPNTQDYGLQVRKITDSKCISPHSLGCGLKVHLQTRSITA